MTSPAQRRTDATTPETQAEGTVLSRSTWILADQALASLFSLVLGFAAARSLSQDDFGIFATLFTSLLLVRGVVRAVALDPIAIRYSGVRAHDHVGHATAITVAVGVTGSLLALLAAALIDAFTVPDALACGVALLALLMIDTSRLVDIAAGRPLRAVQSSAILLAATVVVFTASWVMPVGLAPLLGLSALASLLALTVRRPMWGRRHPLPESRRWLREQRALAGPLLLDFLTNAGALFLIVYLLAWIDLTEAGVFRAAQMVSGPLFMLFTGVTQVVMTEGARSVAPSGGGRDQTGRELGILVAQRSLALSIAASLGYLGLVYVNRDLLGAALRITDRQHLGTLTEMVILAGLTSPSFVASGLLRALAQPRLLLGARLISLIPVIGAAVYGALHQGAAGVVRYGIYAQLVNLPLWSFCVAAAIKTSRRTTT